MYEKKRMYEKNRMYDHGGAMIVINFFILPLSFMLQLAAAAPGLFMPLFMLLLKMTLLKIRAKNRSNDSKCFDLAPKVAT